MKRYFVAGTLVILMGFAVYLSVFLRGASFEGLQIAPADTSVYFEISDVAQTIQRWRQTAIFDILNEPSVKNFLRDPISRVPKRWFGVVQTLTDLRCEKVFFCAPEDPGHGWIIGIRTQDDNWREKVAKIGIRCTDPGAREIISDVPVHGGLYALKINSWILMGPDLTVVEKAAQTRSHGGLETNRLFQQCRTHLPAVADLFWYADGNITTRPLYGTPIRLTPEGTRVRAICGCLNFDGKRLRDTIFTATDSVEGGPPLDRDAVKLTGSKTVAYMAARVGLTQLWRVSKDFSNDWPVAGLIYGYLNETKVFGIEPQDLDRLVSSAELILDRQTTTDALQAAVSLRVSDPDRIQHLMDEVVREKLPDSCRKTTVGDVQAYMMNNRRHALMYFGLFGTHLLVAWNESAFLDLVHRLSKPVDDLEKNEIYRNAVKLVPTANDVFAYLDTQTGFNRLYEALRPMLMFSAALVPQLSNYIDAENLPDCEAISRHLSPIVLSRSKIKGGFMDESTGPITAYQATLLLVGGTFLTGMMH